MYNTKYIVRILDFTMNAEQIIIQEMLVSVIIVRKDREVVVSQADISSCKSISNPRYTRGVTFARSKTATYITITNKVISKPLKLT